MWKRAGLSKKLDEEKYLVTVEARISGHPNIGAPPIPGGHLSKNFVPVMHYEVLIPGQDLI